jgi:alkylated DNA repair protein alkB homolog 6
MAEKMFLESFRITTLPESIYYIPNFLTDTEHSTLLSELSAVPPAKWTQLSHRRLIASPSPLTGVNKDTLLRQELPTWLSIPVLPKLEKLGLFSDSPHKKPNHCLINEYKPGQGIMPHEDGPGYYPCVATVSLGGYSVLEIYEKGQLDRGKYKWRIVQEPGSLLVTVGEMYKDYLHGIQEVKEDDGLTEETIYNWSALSEEWRTKVARNGGKAKRETRTSLTFRDVPKVRDLPVKLPFLRK